MRPPAVRNPVGELFFSAAGCEMMESPDMMRIIYAEGKEGQHLARLANRTYLAALVVILAFYAEGCGARHPEAAGDGATHGFNASPVVPAAASARAGDELALLQHLRKSGYRMAVHVRLSVDGKELPPAELAVAADATPPRNLSARGRAYTDDSGRPLEIAAYVRDGTLHHTTSSLSGWVAQPFRGLHQVYSLVGAIDDIGLLADLLAEDGVTVSRRDGELVITPDPVRVARLLERREEVQADVLAAEFALRQTAPGQVAVRSRIVLGEGEEKLEMKSTSDLAGLESPVFEARS